MWWDLNLLSTIYEHEGQRKYTLFTSSAFHAVSSSPREMKSLHPRMSGMSEETGGVEKHEEARD
jgi:hypothetical protein